MDLEVKKRAEAWPVQSEVFELMKTPEKLADAFFKDLTFGTGGMRGLMGVGTNRMNLYTVRAATQGLANYLKKQSGKNLSVFIGFDVRHNSKEFAEEASRVLIANKIKVYLTNEICPTPLVSFGCRHFGCTAAIMITASHNPPAYNGYKVYWSDGAQVVPPHDEGIIEEVRKVSIAAPMGQHLFDSPLLTRVGPELDQAYLKELKKWQLYPSAPLKIIYTPLHGTGIRIVPEALNQWGYHQVIFVEKQKKPDGDFTFCPIPNPEDKSALELGSNQLLADEADLLIATDPDADRIGVVVRDHQKAVPLTGNQMACIALFHIGSTLSARGECPKNGAFIKTIVTTELFRKIGMDFGATCIDVLTGFKYIAEQIKLWEQGVDPFHYLFGAEESYGCLYGNMARDKDAVSAACLFAEIAAVAKKQNVTLIDRLYQIYQKYGIHRESLTGLNFPDTEAGMIQMQTLMTNLRKNPPISIGGIAVISIEDYLTGLSKNLKDGSTIPLSLPKSDVLRFWLADQSKLVIRPSGTEPKVKLYGEVVQEKIQNLAQDIALCDQRLQALTDAFKHETV